MSKNPYAELSDDERFGAWQGDLKQVWSYVTQLQWDVLVFREVTETVRTNPALESFNKYLISWIADLFARSAAVTCRALVDGDARGYSLLRILNDMKAHPALFTAERLLAAIPESARQRPDWAIEEAFNRKSFDRLWPDPDEGDRVRKIQAWIDDLRAATARIERYVNEHVAHLDRDPSTVLPTFNDLFAAADAIAKIANDLSVRLNNVTMAAPRSLHHWQEIMDIPWRRRPDAEDNQL